MKCPKCNNEISSDAEFCCFCGHKSADDESTFENEELAYERKFEFNSSVGSCFYLPLNNNRISGTVILSDLGISCLVDHHKYDISFNVLWEKTAGARMKIKLPTLYALLLITELAVGFCDNWGLMAIGAVALVIFIVGFNIVLRIQDISGKSVDIYARNLSTAIELCEEINNKLKEREF